MPTTAQMLRTYPQPVLAAIAELRNAILDGSEKPDQLLELLAAQLTDPESVQSAFDEVAEATPNAQKAIESLLRNGGEMATPQFTREYGSIRQMGTAKLERDRPWEMPESIAELLYYHGLIGSGFEGVGPSARNIVFIPSDVSPWLPAPETAAVEQGLAVRPVAPPPPSCLLLTDDSFLEDAGSLIGFLHSDVLHLTPDGAKHAEDVQRFLQRLQIPFGQAEDGEDSLTRTYMEIRLDLLLHLAKRLGWLKLGDESVIELSGNRVRAFLEVARAEQRQLLWDAWRTSPEWNDLQRTPGLEFANQNNWANDPLQARANILQVLAHLAPDGWFSQAAVIQAIQEAEPDFQRPTGEYDTWYIRSSTTQEYLKGFEQWDAVEGALLRFYIRGPLHWLGALDLAEPTSGDDYQLSLSDWGAHWLLEDRPLPADVKPNPLTVGEDFTVTVPYGTPLSVRFRVERFAQWQRSEPVYVYRITQRSLQRALEEQISPEQILSFLRRNSDPLPANVDRALSRYGAAHPS